MKITEPNSHNLNWKVAIPPTSLLGKTVRIAHGPLDGVEGTLVECLSSGRYRLELSEGVYVETSHVEGVLELTTSGHDQSP